MPAGSDPEPVRLDKWLWAARFFKTRGLAVEAIAGGRVQVAGRRVKAGREVRVGDRIAMTLGSSARVEVDVRALARQRRPAAEAALLYEETPDSRAARERVAADRRTAPAVEHGAGRPTKRDRRRLDARRGRG
jgi:ribosome-associated heat shock protein Hsp15